MYIGKEEMLPISRDYKLSVSVCFLSEHEGAHTSTFAVSQVGTESDTCLNCSVDWRYVRGFLMICYNNFAFKESFMVLLKKILLSLLSGCWSWGFNRLSIENMTVNSIKCYA